MTSYVISILLFWPKIIYYLYLIPQELGFSDGVLDRPLAFTQYPVIDQNGNPDTMYPGHIDYVKDGEIGTFDGNGEISLTSIHFPD